MTWGQRTRDACVPATQCACHALTTASRAIIAMGYRRTFVKYVGMLSVGLGAGYYIGTEELLENQSVEESIDEVANLVDSQNTEQPGQSDEDTGQSQTDEATVLESFEDRTLDGWSGTDKMERIEGDAAVGDYSGGIIFDGSEESGEAAIYDDGVEHTAQNISFWIRTTHGENPDDEWSTYDGTDSKFLEFHNHGRGGRTGTMVNGNVKSWIMNSNTWYTVSVENISWENDTIGAVRIVDTQGTEQLRWTDLSFHESGVDGFQKFEISNQNANISEPATTYADGIRAGVANGTGSQVGETSPDASTEPGNTNPECVDRSAVTDPSSPGYGWGDAPLLSDGRHGPYELDLETRESENREHYFGLCVQEGDEITVRMLFSGADLDMSIHSAETNAQADQYESRPKYREVATSWSTSNNETISLTAQSSGTYYIRTYIVTYGMSETYELEVETQ